MAPAIPRLSIPEPPHGEFAVFNNGTAFAAMHFDTSGMPRPDCRASLNDAKRATLELQHGGRDILDLETQSTGLEEVFLELTGRKLNGGGPP